jgi:methionyl aminopeptidase
VITLRSDKEVALLRKANSIVADVLATLAEHVKPGTTTKQLDAMAADIIEKSGGEPSFLGYGSPPFPACTCISVDQEIVHGVPGERVIKEGEIVSMDVGVRWKGYYGDAALTVACGEVDDERKRLMKTTDRALARAIDAARAGNYLVDIGKAVEQTAEAEGFSVVRVFVGHSIGTRMHEGLQIPNFDTGERGPLLKPGMVLALEPMINAGTEQVRVLKDKWTAVTADGRPSAHYEHSIVVREGPADVLSLTPRRVWGQELG